MDKKSFLLGLSFAGVFVFGCVAGQTLLQVPHATATEGLQKWEYYCMNGFAPIPTTRKANAAGQEGWEMVTAAGMGSGDIRWRNESMIWCFRRPL
jgi:hypothetical protein